MGLINIIKPLFTLTSDVEKPQQYQNEFLRTANLGPLGEKQEYHINALPNSLYFCYSSIELRAGPTRVLPGLLGYCNNWGSLSSSSYLGKAANPSVRIQD